MTSSWFCSVPVSSNSITVQCNGVNYVWAYGSDTLIIIRSPHFWNMIASLVYHDMINSNVASTQSLSFLRKQSCLINGEYKDVLFVGSSHSIIICMFENDTNVALLFQNPRIPSNQICCTQNMCKSYHNQSSLQNRPWPTCISWKMHG